MCSCDLFGTARVGCGTHSPTDHRHSPLPHPNAGLSRILQAAETTATDYARLATGLNAGATAWMISVRLVHIAQAILRVETLALSYATSEWRQD